jgi:hypothetical protein
MISRNGKFSGKMLRKIFRTGKFSMENFPPHITTRQTYFEREPRRLKLSELALVVQCGSRPSPDLLVKILGVGNQLFLYNTWFYFPFPSLPLDESY